MKRRTLERREKIKDMIIEDGLWSLNKKQIARDFHVSYPTIYRDIRAILRQIPDDKIDEIGYELNQSFKEALSIARRLLKRKDDSLKLKAVDVLTKAIDRYTGFLEAFGKKPIAPEKLDVNACPEKRTFNVIITTLSDFLEWCEKNHKKDVLKAYEIYKQDKHKKDVSSIPSIDKE